jgi:hypothetical protein
MLFLKIVNNKSFTRVLFRGWNLPSEVVFGSNVAAWVVIAAGFNFRKIMALMGLKEKGG